MIGAVFEWIIVGGAHRIVASPEPVDRGGVTPEEAFQLLATEHGRRVRYFALKIVREWQQPTIDLVRRAQKRGSS